MYQDVKIDQVEPTRTDCVARRLGAGGQTLEMCLNALGRKDLCERISKAVDQSKDFGGCRMGSGSSTGVMVTKKAAS